MFAFKNHLLLAHEVHSLVTEEVRLDADDVLEGRAKITVKEVDVQLEWHRIWRGKQIARSGNKEAKVRRWVDAVEQYKMEVASRMTSLLSSTDVADCLSESDSAMSVESSTVDHMDVDATGDCYD